MRTKKLLLISALTIASLGFLAINNVYAYRGDYTQKGLDYTPEKHEVMEEAFENNDYNAWEELMAGKGRVTEVINEDNFARFSEAHRLAEEGNYEETDKIRQELGLRTRNGDSIGAKYGKGDGQGYEQRNH